MSQIEFTTEIFKEIKRSIAIPNELNFNNKGEVVNYINSNYKENIKIAINAATLYAVIQIENKKEDIENKFDFFEKIYNLMMVLHHYFGSRVHSSNIEESFYSFYSLLINKS